MLLFLSQYYTVVKHVKNYQNCLEEGEAKEFEDEVEYLLDGLQPSQPIPIRFRAFVFLHENVCGQPRSACTVFFGP